MPNTRILNQLGYATVRIDALHLIPQVAPAEGLLRAVETREELPQALLDTMPKYFEALKKYDQLDDLFCGDDLAGHEAWQDLFDHMFSAGICGVIATVSRPVRLISKSLSVSWSWSYYHTELLYADTIEQVLEAALTWATDAEELAYTRRWLGQCEVCGACEGVELVAGMTAYHYEGQLETIEDPNRSLALCVQHAEEYRDHWNAQWDEYIASQG